MSHLMGVMCSGDMGGWVCFPERWGLLRMRLMELSLLFSLSVPCSALVLCQ